MNFCVFIRKTLERKVINAILGYRHLNFLVNGVKQMSVMVNFWEKIFDLLRGISLFRLVQVLFPKLKNNPAFVDYWVMGNLFFSFLAICVVNGNFFPTLNVILLIYGYVRVFEIFVYQVNVLLFDQFKTSATYKLQSYRRMVIALIHNFIEIIFWFAVTYTFHQVYILPTGKDSLTVFESIYMSFFIMTTFSLPIFDKPQSNGLSIILLQSIIGVFMTLVTLARFISLLPKPGTLDTREEEIEKITIP